MARNDLNLSPQARANLLDDDAIMHAVAVQQDRDMHRAYVERELRRDEEDTTQDQSNGHNVPEHPNGGRR